MAERRCEKCGSIIPNGAKACPNCGCPVEQQSEETTAQNMPNLQQDDSYKTVSELFWSCEFYKVFRGSKFDLAQRIYEVGALWWETIIQCGGNALLRNLQHSVAAQQEENSFPLSALA